MTLEDMKLDFNSVFFERKDKEPLDFNVFNNLCYKAKELWWNIASLESDSFSYLRNEFLKLTPIEQIFKMAFHLYFKYFENAEIYKMYDISLKSQVEIISQNKKYRVDFIIDKIYYMDKSKIKVNKIKKPIVIETDGYDSHSSKEQLNYDIERENNLKLDGYNVIRFTGSQIYKEPYDCVMKVLKCLYDENEELFKFLRGLKSNGKQC